MLLVTLLYSSSKDAKIWVEDLEEGEVAPKKGAK